MPLPSLARYTTIQHYNKLKRILMSWLYLFMPIVIVITLYTVLDRKRLLLFYRIKHISQGKDEMVKIEMPVSQLERLTSSTISHTINTGSALLFEYRTMVYMAIPLGENDSLVSLVADRSMIERYRKAKSKRQFKQ